MNNKNYLYYNNRNVYGKECFPKNEGILNYLIKSKFLSEFLTNEEKLQVLYNLGILQIIDNLLHLIDKKVNISQLSDYVTLQYFLRKIEELKPHDEKSKGYFSSLESLLLEYPTGEDGDWAIVNVRSTWYVYRYKTGTGWELSGEYDNNIDLSEYLKLLVSGENIKTINGESILGEGNIEITLGTELPEDYATKSDVAKETLRALTAENNLKNRLDNLNPGEGGIIIPENCATKEDVLAETTRAQAVENTLINRLDILEGGPHSYILDGIKHVIIKKSLYDRLTEYENNALYFVTRDWTFGDEFPIVFIDSDTTWTFGKQFPIVFTNPTWKFGELFPIVFTDTIS